ncbi:MAG: hypothetical protein JWL69_3511 [Phycisphaerales bacterium]|nr:hypothetical protein [Phycisphaerales bacterium]MDB5358120.1 hypothetical protein [Phycisphaerales bacterium]
MKQRSEKTELPSREAIALGYEQEVVSRRAMLILLFWFIVMAVVLNFFLWFVMKHYISIERGADFPTSVVKDDIGPPPPRLQPSVQHDDLPAQDMQDLLAEEDRMFSRLGWQVNPDTHAVTIPGDIVARVARETHARAASPTTLPTASPNGVNTYLPGPPSPSNTRQNGGSPQGPTPNLLPDPPGQGPQEPRTKGGREL